MSATVTIALVFALAYTQWSVKVDVNHDPADARHAMFVLHTSGVGAETPLGRTAHRQRADIAPAIVSGARGDESLLLDLVESPPQGDLKNMLPPLLWERGAGG